MIVCFFNSIPNSEYSNLSIVSAFSKSSFSCKTSSPDRKLYLTTFTDDKGEILATSLSKLY